MNEWQAYTLYNRAVADVFFTEDADGQPVYLDLDEEPVAQIAQRVGESPEELCDRLAQAARGVLNLQTSYVGAFGPLLQQTTRWLRAWRTTSRSERPRLEPPPVLAMLAVFSVAAERMGRDTGMAPNNYFGRLAQVLALNSDHDKHRVEAQYRQHVEFFWNVLSTWLTGLDGMRGLPSAVALTHRYIGLSISQALVREHDRRKLPRFFETYGFNPGQEVSPYEMQPLLNEWMDRQPPPISKNIVALWKRQAAARERIASIVALELQAWDGSGLGGASPSLQPEGTRGEARLIALPRSGLFGSGPKVELGIVARIRGPEHPRRLSVISAVGADKPGLDFLPGVNGWYRLHRPADFGNASLLDGVLKLADDDGTTIQRRPRRVLPMRKDDTLGLFLEAERLQLAEDSLIFAAADMAGQVETVLQEVARPGYRQVKGEAAGIPGGWVLFMDVQILGLLPAATRASTASDLNVLLPAVASQLTFAEGMRLPGRLRKYSAAAPPEIRAVAVSAEHLELRVLNKDNDDSTRTDDAALTTFDEVVCQHSAHGAALILSLSHEHLPIGDYEVLLYLDHAKDPSQRLPFSLRSGDSVDLAMWSRSPRLVHQPARWHGHATMSAEDWQDSPPPVVDGATAIGGSGPASATMAPRQVWWTGRRPAGHSEAATMTLTTPDPSSCLVTGAHYFDLPYATATSVQGVCRHCSLVKRFPNKHWLAKAGRHSRDRAEASYHVDVHELEPVSPGVLTWDVGLDALMHAGGGTYPALERIALQIEASLLFADTFTRTLEVLGHVEIQRDQRTLAPVAWEIAPSALAELADGSYLLTGFWPAALIKSLLAIARDFGATLHTNEPPGQPPRRSVTGIIRSSAHQIAEQLSETTAAVAVADDAARAILRAAPGLAAVEASLPQLSMPGVQRIQKFDLGSAAWVTQHHAHLPGAYRLESYGSTYIIRREDDLEAGTARTGTAQLVKHLEARRAGRPLIAYDERHHTLDVPLGAELPGLLGRAAVLCSGRSPEKIRTKRLVRYAGVPSDVADMLAARLCH